MTKFAKETRKEMVKAIEKITGQKAKYLGVPSCAYQVGEFTVTKDGAIEGEGDGLDLLIESLAFEGFLPEEENIGLAVSIPADKVDAGNLINLLAAKGDLIKKALGIDDLGFTIEEDKATFPWFKEASPEEIQAYTKFISAICKMSKEHKITAKAKVETNEKYAFRCFLLRLGFIGDEYKADRKILLKNLEGSAAFKSERKEVI